MNQIKFLFYVKGCFPSLKALGIYYADQCDKNKCTSIKIFNKKDSLSFPLFWFKKKERIRRKSIVLTPYAKLLLPEDRKIVQDEGITVLDCSWKKKNPILNKKFKNGRKLPKLLAGNPVNYGKWEFLTSMEAVSGSLFIMGFEQEASEILNALPWGRTFWDLNKELLISYQSASNEQSYKEIWDKFF